MKCKQNVVVAVLAGVLAGTVLGAGTSHIAQVISYAPGDAGVHESAPRTERVYRNSRSVRLEAEQGVEAEMPRSSAVFRPFAELRTRLRSAFSVKTVRECRGLVGAPLARCTARISAKAHSK